MASNRTADTDITKDRRMEGGDGAREGEEMRTRTRRRRRSGMMTFWRVVALGLVLAVGLIGETEGMDITAFEYFRKFGKHLELGECPQRELSITLPNNTTVVRQETCIARQRGNVTNIPRVVSDIRHVVIPSANDLVAYLGLCGGEAASYLGILNSGDCIVVDIASRLTFSKKTMVRAYYVYFHKSLDILDTEAAANSPLNGRVREGLQEYLQNKFYVKNRSYGTLEIVLVQFRFRSSKEVEAAEKLTLPSADTLMSEYMKRLEREVGKPKRVMVLTLSTATEVRYKVERYAAKQWGSAVRDVEIREAIVNLTRQRIDSGRIRPNLNYQLFPFVAEEGQEPRSNPGSWEMWEETSMLEVSLRVSISTAKKSAKLCRKNKTKLCRRVRELRRKLVALQVDIHNGRSRWTTLTQKQQQELARRFSRRVTSFGRMTRSLARQVRKMKKEEKLKELNDKKKKPNEVLPVSGRIGIGKVEQQRPRDWSYIQRIKKRWPRVGHRG